MKYDLKLHIDREKIFNKILQLLKTKDKVVELKEKREQRSNFQNSYLHALLAIAAIEVGETKEYMKQTVYKETVNRDEFKTEFHNKKKNYTRPKWKSTKDMNTKETSIQIERFRNFAASRMCYLFSADEYKANRVAIDNDIVRHKEYL